MSERELQFRAPASSVIAETLRVQSGSPPRSRVARLFGLDPLHRDSRSWYLGAIGELEIGRLLDQLSDECSVMHAIPVGSRGSDIDHLIIGPAGVFTINTKYHEGKKVWVGSKRLLVNGQRTDHLRKATFEAGRVARILTAAAGEHVEARPIVAIVAARSITVRERPEDVVVLPSTRLVKWLHRQPVVLPEEQLARLRQLALAPATWGDPPSPLPDLEEFAALRQTVASARRRRIGWALAAMVSPWVVAAGYFGLML